MVVLVYNIENSKRYGVMVFYMKKINYKKNRHLCVVITSERKKKREYEERKMAPVCADSLTFFNELRRNPVLSFTYIYIIWTTLFLAIQHTLDFQWAISRRPCFVIKNTRITPLLLLLHPLTESDRREFNRIDFTVPKFVVLLVFWFAYNTPNLYTRSSVYNTQKMREGVRERKKSLNVCIQQLVRVWKLG